MTAIVEQEFGRPFCRGCDLIYEEMLGSCPTCGKALTRFAPNDAAGPYVRFGFAVGFCALMLLHLLQVLVSVVLPDAWSLMPLTQFLYAIPLWRWFRKRGYDRAGTGVVVAVGVSALVLGSILGFMLYLFSSFS